MRKPLFFEGIICPLITPLNEDFTLDVVATEHLIRHIVSGGIQGIFILGTTGEASSLSYAVKRKLIEISAVTLAETQLPLLVGIGDSSLAESVALAEFAKANGATAVVATAPFYFDLEPEDMQRYFLSLADQIALPLYLYNYPKSTHFNLVPEVVRQLQQHPNIMGIKDSSGDKAYMNALIEISKETAFNVLIGPEEILTELLLQGAQGGVNGGSNIFPSLYTQLYKATLKNDFDQREQLQKLVMQLSEGVYALEGGVNSYLKGIKAAAAALGLCKNILSPPLKAAESDIADSIAATVQDIKSALKKI